MRLKAPTKSESDEIEASDISPSVDEDESTRLRPGESLAGRFTILRFIAQGGMGTVYEATDLMLRAGVALKVIRGRIATDATAMERFRREVLLARRVTHVNVCRVYESYDAMTSSGVPIHFLTMELLEAETLGQRLARQGAMTTAEALPLVRQLCNGLAAAHSQGVIHRDFKSSNVMVVSDDKSLADSSSLTRVVITDFGIARAVQPNGDEGPSAQLTGGDGILGTPEYMAPEQVTGGEVTQAADIYALGIVMYEMVTGRLPFIGGTALAVAAKRLHEAPPRPEAAMPGLDPRWSETILRCLAREPDRRFKSVLDIPPELVRAARRWPSPVATSAAVLVTALAAFAFLMPLPSVRKTQPPPAPPAAVTSEVLLPQPASEPNVPMAAEAVVARTEVVSPGLASPSPGRKRAPLRNRPPVGPPGKLVLTVDPWGEVFIDGASRGEEVGRVEYQLPSGTHQVEVKGPSSWGPKQILIESEKTFSQAVSLE